MRMLLILALALPALAHADEMWRWRDGGGGLHYSNVPEKAPSGAARIDRGIGYLEGTVDEPDPKGVQDSLAEIRRRHEERAIRRRLNAIEAYREDIRTRQRERLMASSNVQLLADWQVADRWLQLRDEAAGLERQLGELEHPQPGS